MSTKVATQVGHPVPPAPRHSVTVHMPTWKDVENFAEDPAAAVATYKNTYPRMAPHRDIGELSEAVLQLLGTPDQGCLLFASLQSATECITYSTSTRRDNGCDKIPVPADHIGIKAFIAKDTFFAVVFPLEHATVVRQFWKIPGAGISSRFAEANLKHKLVAVALPKREGLRLTFDDEAHEELRKRILRYLCRAPLDPRSLQPKPSTNDIYFFQTGMASIYKTHSYLLQIYGGVTVIFGMAFVNTIDVMEGFGPGYKLFGRGDESDLRDLETLLENERQNGRKVQAIWTDFPSNPLLVTPDIVRLRKLANEYDTILVIDDTIGSWSNIDIMSMADILITSLTKTFNGYADAIAGSAIINPASPKYAEFKSLFDKHYVPELYVDDVVAIEKNSRDYLSRTTKLSHNAWTLAEYLHSRSKEPGSSIVAVYYPTINPSIANYKQFMRPATDDFTPGYGCLFSVEFKDILTAVAFFDALNVHKGAHLGAPFTLAFPFTLGVYYRKLDWVAQYGLKPTQIRVSVGLEDTETLVEEFRVAVEAADAV
ncbi:PLP-dependent transferase [Cadophora sp. DSE1049]|nr:PLP-dependent transferase [Cadophora sp. DSE1049]